MEFNVYKITLKSEEKIQLPYYSGFAFRGLFGNALKKTTCVFKSLKKSCNNCILKKKCLYSTIFESTKNKENGVLKGVPSTPHPYILMPEKFDMQFIRKGSTGSLFLTLIGEADEYLPFMIFAFEKMGIIGVGKNRGKFFIKDVRKLIGLNNSKVIYSKNDDEIKKSDFKFSFQFFQNLTLKSDKIIIESFTPARIKKTINF